MIKIKGNVVVRVITNISKFHCNYTPLTINKQKRCALFNKSQQYFLKNTH